MSGSLPLRLLCAAVSLAALPRLAAAHVGELDPSFGTGGIAYFPLSENGSCLSGASAVAVHPDGSIWVVGWARDAANPAHDAAYLKLGASGQILADNFGYEETDLRAIAINDANGEIYIAGNQGNVVSVRALDSGGNFDTSFGNNGSRGVAVNGDVGHQTTVNDLKLDPGGSLYMTGNYNGTGVQQIMLAYLSIDGTVQSVEAMTNNTDDFIPTALAIQPPSGRLLVSGYTDGSCANEAYDVTFSTSFHFTPDTSYMSPRYGFAGTAGCFVDSTALLNDDGSLIEAGRVLQDDGTWFAMWQKVDANGALSDVGHPFYMSPWGTTHRARCCPFRTAHSSIANGCWSASPASTTSAIRRLGRTNRQIAVASTAASATAVRR